MEISAESFLLHIVATSGGALLLALAFKGFVHGVLFVLMPLSSAPAHSTNEGGPTMSSKDPTEDEVLAWESATCRDCGFSFPKNEAWATRCIGCFKKSKGYARVIADNSFLWAQHEMRRLELKLKQAQQELAARGPQSRPSAAASSDGISDELLEDIVRLCHPDLHSNSERATKAAQALLSLRAARRAAKASR